MRIRFFHEKSPCQLQERKTNFMQISNAPNHAILVEHAAVQKDAEAVDMIHRKNSRSRSGGQPDYIIRLEYEPRLIVRSSTRKYRGGR